MYVTGIFEHYLKTEKKCNDVDIALEKKHVGAYIAQKISDLNRKKTVKTAHTPNAVDILEAGPSIIPLLMMTVQKLIMIQITRA